MTDRNASAIELVEADLDKVRGGLLPAVKSATDTGRTSDPSGNTLYIAAGSGGVWKTSNG